MCVNKMDERILVCVYYGPNGERLIRRGSKLANMLNCPLYILTADPSPEDELDIERSHYIERWKELAKEQGMEFIIKYDEKRPISKVIGEVAKEKQITQLVLGQTAQSRWEEITKGSIINTLLHEVPFADIHIVSVSRELKSQEGFFEKGIRAYLVKNEQGYKVTFKHSSHDLFEGIFFKEIGTDFNNGIFRFMQGKKTVEVHVSNDVVTEPERIKQGEHG